MAQSAAGLDRRRPSLAAVLLLALAFAGTQWLLSSHGSKEISFAGGAARTPLGSAGGLRQAVDAAARRRGCTAREAVGLFYATQTGNTETVAGVIAEKAGVEAADVGEYGAEDLAGYDGLIVGCPTWNTDADEYRSGTAWDDLLDDIKGVDLAGKSVAVFGCGDSQGYGDNFCDGIEELHETFAAAGAKMVGYVDAGAYQHQASKSAKGDKFLGLPLDEDNENDMTEERVESWIAQIKGEGMPL
jgi:flavodoxin I